MITQPVSTARQAKTPGGIRTGLLELLMIILMKTPRSGHHLHSMKQNGNAFFGDLIIWVQTTEAVDAS